MIFNLLSRRKTRVKRTLKIEHQRRVEITEFVELEIPIENASAIEQVIRKTKWNKHD